MDAMEELEKLFRRQSLTGSTDNADLADSSGADLFLKLISNPFKSAFQANAFWFSIASAVGVTLFLAFIFSLFRPRHTLVYAPKLKHADEKHAPPAIGRGFLAWVRPVMRTNEDYLVDRIGLDATIFLRFTRMCRNIFLVLAVIGCGIMIPINVSQSNKTLSKGQSLFAIMTPLYVFNASLWSHVIVAWVFDIIVAFFLWHNYRRVRTLRRRYFQSTDYQLSLHARTLMVTDLPGPLRTDEGILRVTDEVNPTGILPRAAVGRNVQELPELVKEHNKTVRELEYVLAKYLKNPDKLPINRPTIRPAGRSTGKVDAIEYLTRRIQELEMKIKDVREVIDRRNAMPYGFASWEQIEQAHTVAYAARNKSPQGAAVQLAPRPNDIIWENLPLTKRARTWKKTVNVIWVIILTVVWVAPNAMIAVFLADLPNLGLLWPRFQKSLDAHSKGWAVVQGIASPALMSLFYLILPIIFRRLSIRAGDITKTIREQHVIHNLYAFFVFNNLIIFSLFSAAWGFVTAVVDKTKEHESAWQAIKDGQFYVKLMISLCSSSPYWVTWLLQRNLGAAIDIAQLIQLSWIWYIKTFMAPTPRQTIEWTAPQPFDYASYYNYFLFYSTVALCYATLQPIVLPVTALYFGLDAYLKKYLLMYIYVTKTESGGQFWRVVYNRMIAAMILANCIVGLVVKARGTWTMVFATVPLPILMLAFKYYCHRTFDADCDYYTRGQAHVESSLGIGKPHVGKTRNINNRFGHPALYKPLITPMVHAKAHHVLKQIYSGRIDDPTRDGGAGSGLSDIAMGPMVPAQTGKAAHVPENAPFELVQEGQMDFSYFKNRSDFRDEHGGGGGLYGRPDDLMTERSQTPRSFLGSGEGDSSPVSSRESSLNGRRHKRFESGDSVGASAAAAATAAPGVYPGDYDHPAFRDERRRSQIGGGGDIGMSGGLYTNPNESESRLLNYAQTPGQGGVLGVDRWRTGGSGYGPVAQGHEDEEASGYDYYRGRTGREI